MKTLLFCALALLALLPAHADTYRLHTVRLGGLSGLVRITNLLDEDGLVEIRGFDDQGEEYGLGWLDMEERASVTLSGEEIEQGAPDKGLHRGIGDGLGGWQLELETDLELAALSYVLNGETPVVLSAAETAHEGEELPPRFMWAPRLVDGNARRFASADSHRPDWPGALGALSKDRETSPHELLSAYDWIPGETFQGVDLGWGDYEHPDDATAPWTRFGGHLDYSAFAVQQGTIDSQPAAHAYTIGQQSGCSEYERSLELIPPAGTEWRGAAVFVTPEGEFGHGPVSFRLDQAFSVGEEYGDQPLVGIDIKAPAHEAETESASRYTREGGIIIFGELARLPGIQTAWNGIFEFFGPTCEEISG